MTLRRRSLSASEKVAKWRKVDRCKHKHLTDYEASGTCENQPNACGGWAEVHCRDCEVFISDCYCKYNAGMSFASSGFYRTIEKKRRLVKVQRDERPLAKMMKHGGFGG